MPLVFTYGPDTVQGRMYDRIGPSEFVGTAIIDGYKLVFDKPNMKNKAEGLPNLQPTEGSAAFGLLFELTPKQFEILDGFFGGYERKVLDVALTDPDNPITRPARTWLARRTKDGLKPTDVSIELVQQGLEENEAPDRFNEELEEFEVLVTYKELIVGFEEGVSEDDAKSAVEAAGGKVRRRMRTDSKDEVMLLVRTQDLAALKKAMKKDKNVKMTEENVGGFTIS